MAVTPAFLVVASAVVFGTEVVAMSGAEFDRDILESDGVLELLDAALKFFLVSGG